MKALRVAAGLAMLLSPGVAARAQEPPPGHDAAELAKQLSNPVASLVAVPFQNNRDFSLGPEDQERYTLNFQPVTPFAVNDDWNLRLAMSGSTSIGGRQASPEGPHSVAFPQLR